MTPEQAMTELADAAQTLDSDGFHRSARCVRDAADCLEAEIRDLREQLAKVSEAIGEVITDERSQTRRLSANNLPESAATLMACRATYKGSGKRRPARRV